jgi:hypothetical protein
VLSYDKNNSFFFGFLFKIIFLMLIYMKGARKKTDVNAIT